MQVWLSTLHIDKEWWDMTFGRNQLVSWEEFEASPCRLFTTSAGLITGLLDPFSLNAVAPPTGGPSSSRSAPSGRQQAQREPRPRRATATTAGPRSAATAATAAGGAAAATGTGSGTARAGAEACLVCGRTGVKLQRCARCRDAWYCSVECQKQHWPQHKAVCRPADA